MISDDEPLPDYQAPRYRSNIGAFDVDTSEISGTRAEATLTAIAANGSEKRVDVVVTMDDDGTLRIAVETDNVPRRLVRLTFSDGLHFKQELELKNTPIAAHSVDDKTISLL